MPRLHLVLERPAQPVLDTLADAGDHVLDLSIRPRLSALDVAALSDRGAVVHAGGQNTQASFEASRHRVLIEHAATFGANGPVAAALGDLVIDGLGLWWLLPIASKHLPRNPWPWLIQRTTWLTSDQGHATLRKLADGMTDWVIWAPSHWEARMVAACTGATDWEVRDPETGELLHGPRVRARLNRDFVEAQARNARTVAMFTAWQSERPSGPMPQDIDVLFAMDTPTWRKLPDHWENRYLDDFPERLQAQGAHIAWLPTVEFAEGLATQAEALEGRGTVVWDALPDLAEVAGRCMVDVARMQLRFQRVARAIMDGPPILLAGLDIREPLVLEMSHMLSQQALNYAINLRASREAVARVGPRATLYRNEYYPFGLVYGHASRGWTERWSLQHGTLHDEHFGYFWQPPLLEQGDRAGLAGPPVPDRLLTYGEAVDELLVGLGYPAGKLAPVGSLRHDALVEASHSSARPDNDVPVLLLCGSFPWFFRSWLDLLVQGIQRSGLACRVLVKPHPRYADAVDIDGILGAAGFSDYEIVGGPLEPFIERADVILTDASTTALEASVLGCPPICFCEADEHERVMYVAEHLALPAHDGPSMAAALKAVTAPDYLERWEPKRQAFLGRHLANTVRPSAEAVAGLLDAPRPTADVTVVIAAWNAEQTIEAALRSLKRQTLPPRQVIVVDDHSTDRTRERVEAYALDGLELRRTPCNAGPGAARNVGFDHASCTWVAILDSDDTWHPTRLERLLAHSRDVDVIVDDLDRRAGERVLPSSFTARGIALDRPQRLTALDFVRWDLGTAKPLIRRSALTCRGLRFDADLPAAEDMDLYLTLLLENAEGRIVPEALYRYHFRPGQITSDPGLVSEANAKATDKLLRTAIRVGNQPVVDALEARRRRIRHQRTVRDAAAALRAGDLGEMARMVGRDPGVVPFALGRVLDPSRVRDRLNILKTRSSS